jgi:hypothetical protein
VNLLKDVEFEERMVGSMRKEKCIGFFHENLQLKSEKNVHWITTFVLPPEFAQKKLNVIGFEVVILPESNRKYVRNQHLKFNQMILT